MPDSRDVDPTDGRDETASERYDRNWDELLQELRVTQTGTQIISGFLLTVAFQQRFPELPGYQIAMYVVLVILAAATTAVGLGMVSLHRVLFRRHEKQEMVGIGNTLLQIDLLLVSILTAGVALFILDFVAGLTVGVVAGAAVLVALIGLLLVLPEAARKHRATTRSRRT